MRNLPPRFMMIAGRLIACLLLLALVLPWAGPAAAQPPSGSPAAAPLLIDINPGPDGSRPTGFVRVGDLIYFAADDGTHGRELWRTDGTQAGTWMLKDMTAGPAGAGMRNDIAPGLADPLLSQPTPLDDTLFFLHYSGDSAYGRGVELWRSDGTPAGTALVEPIGYWSFYKGCSYSLARFGKHLAITRGTPTEWWCGGAVTIHSGVAGGTLWSKTGTISEMIALDGRTYFFLSSYSADTPSGLWASVDTAELVAFVEPFAPDSSLKLRGAGDGSFYFSTVLRDENQDISAHRLWKSTGAPGGIAPLKDLPPSNEFIASTVFSQSLIFAMFDNLTGKYDLWRSDGTAAGTIPIKPLIAGFESNLQSWRSISFIPIGGRLAFDGPGSCAPAASSFSSLWTTDGSAAGTGMVRPGLRIRDYDEPAPSYYEPMLSFEDQVVFSATESQHGRETWISDGSAAGTRLLADLAPGAAGSNPAAFAALPGTILLSADDGSSGQELWVLDPAAPPPPDPAAGSFRLHLPLVQSAAPACAAP